MMRSLYLRTVLFYVATILASLVVSFFVIFTIFRSNAFAQVERDLLAVGKEAIANYERLGEPDIDFYLTNMAHFNYTFYFYTKDVDGKRYGSRSNLKLLREDIDHVLNGGVYRGMTRDDRQPNEKAVGLPFELKGEPAALFIQANVESITSFVNKIVWTMLATILVVGSVFIALATRWIVRPIRQLIQATKQVADGDFTVALPIRGKGEITELAEHFNEMTHRLSQIDQMRQDFVANVSHELQSPMTSIRGFAIALQDGTIPPTMQGRYLQIIERESERLSQLSATLLKLASLDSGEHPMRWTTINVTEQLQTLTPTFEPLLSAKAMTLAIEPLPNIRGDADLLAQVWHNLIHNAIKFGATRVTVSTIDGAIAIHNDGTPIDPDVLPFIFQRFYKGDRSHSRKEGGHGLGLAIVKRIVELHDWTIDVTSDEQGTTFFVRIH